MLPTLTAIFLVFAALAATALAFVAGVYYLCRGRRVLGVFLMSVSVLLALYLVGGRSSPEAVGGF